MMYKMAKREANKVVTIAKKNAYERLYKKLESKKGDNEVFKLARGRGKDHAIRIG